jgi:very-short-patch-repair endonuclease
LWTLSSFEPGPVVLTVPPDRRRQAPGLVHRAQLLPPEVTVVDGIPVTTPARTLLDVAATAAREAVEEALDDALRRRLVTVPRLHWHVARWEKSRLPGTAVLRALLRQRDPAHSPPHSVFETKLLRELVKCGLPSPVRQYPIVADGRTVARLDFAYPEVQLGIEADSRRWHSSRLRWEHDRARLNQLMLLGWRIIHVTWSDLIARPRFVVETVQRALGLSASRGRSPGPTSPA